MLNHSSRFLSRKGAFNAFRHGRADVGDAPLGPRIRAGAHPPRQGVLALGGEQRRVPELRHGLPGQRGGVPDAVTVFEKNVERFPGSANAYDSLGEAYAAAGQREKAIASYERSLVLDPKNANALEWLGKLR